MCGRFTLSARPEVLAAVFELFGIPTVSPRYNVAPTQSIAVVRAGSAGRELTMLRWGLIPAWARDRTIASRLLNARAETLAEKPAFRSALRHRRCVVPADGFFEWRREGRAKQPYLFRRPDRRPFGFAGLWERWEPAGAVPVETCTIVTVGANATVRPFHERMPAILVGAALDAWLADAGTSVLAPADDAFLIAEAVNPIVNGTRVDDARCIAPLVPDANLFA